MILQQLLMDVTGESFPDFMQQTVLGPLGMIHSTFGQPMAMYRKANTAIPYRMTGEQVEGGAYVYPEMAAAGLWTTAGDLAPFAVSSVMSSRRHPIPDHASVGFWVRRFLLEHLVHERGVSRNTQQSYRDTFCLFLPFVATQRKTAVDKLVIEDLAPKIVSDFLSHLGQARSCSVATRNQRLAALHAFARFTGECSPEYVDWCAQIRRVPFKRAWKNAIPYLEKDEMDGLLRAPDPTSEYGRRDYALLLFLYNSGARATEVAQVVIEDLTRDSTGAGSVKIHGKGRKVGFCPLWKKTMSELQPLIRGRDVANPLFLNRYGDAMTRFGIHALVTRHVKSAAETIPSLKTTRISPHTIRHTTATHLLRAGVDLNTIRAWLGHVSPDTTNIYAETDLVLKAKALAACDPGGGHRRIKKRWRDDPSLMEFLRKL